MIKYAEIINEETGLCRVAIGDNEQFYLSIGMSKYDVEQSEVDNNWYLTTKCPHYTQEELTEKEAERVSMLNLTAADVERALYKAKGMDFEDIVSLIQTQQLEGLDIKALKIELKANNFYRGNPYISQVGALLGITETQLNEFFETNDYTKLLSDENSEQ